MHVGRNPLLDPKFVALEVLGCQVEQVLERVESGCKNGHGRVDD